MAFVFCNNCGHRNPANSNFCSSCGAALDVGARRTRTITFHPVDPLQDAPGPTTTPSSAWPTCPPAAACSSCGPGPQAGLKVLARRSRSPGSVAIPTATSSSTTSPCRAATPRSSSANGAFIVRDVGSLNGTYLNQKRVEEAALHNGDELQVGKFRLRLPRRAGRELMADQRGRRAGDRTSRSARCSALLHDEFPDVTISKIRFLESQGLIDPERTPSGYRKFYDDDVERLRFILREQKEHFLPLKVIKDRLDSRRAGVDDDGNAAARWRDEPTGADRRRRAAARRAADGRAGRRAPGADGGRRVADLDGAQPAGRPHRAARRAGRRHDATRFDEVAAGGRARRVDELPRGRALRAGDRPRRRRRHLLRRATPSIAARSRRRVPALRRRAPPPAPVPKRPPTARPGCSSS